MSEQLENLLIEVGECILPAKKRTLFSLGGRGYYENPCSDLLAFFLNPNEEHGLSVLFLDAFLECVVEASKKTPVVACCALDFGDSITVMREVETGTGGRLDLVLQGSKGVLLIENKIRHHQKSNPFDAYEEYGKLINHGLVPLMVILSPDGYSDHQEWVGVSYRDFCRRLESALDRVTMDGGPSKWWFFAKEFVQHFQDELYSTTMTPEQIKLAEKYEFQIQKAKELGEAYRRFLNERLREILSKTLPDNEISTQDVGWGIRCKSSRWGESDIVWVSQVSPSGTSYGMNFYLNDPTPEQLAFARNDLNKALGCEQAPGWERGRVYHWWIFKENPMTREDAEKKLIQMAQIMDKTLCPAVGDPGQDTP